MTGAGRLRTLQLAVMIAIMPVLQGCGSDDKPTPKAVCGLDSELVATVLGSNDLSEGKSTDGALSGADETGYYTCKVMTDSYASAKVTAAIQPVPADILGKMEQMPVRYTYEQGDAALEIRSGAKGDAAVSSLDARWVCGRIAVRVTATSKETIREDDAKSLLEHAADEVGCPAA